MRRYRKCRGSLPRAEFMERRLFFSAATLGATTASGVLIQPDKTGVAGVLLELLDGTITAQSQGIAVDSKGRVSVEITAKNVTKIKGPLAKLGFVSTGAEPKDHFIDGYLPVAALKTIGSLSRIGLMGVIPAPAAGTLAGAVDSEGDAAMEADRARAASGDNGAGVTVGALSDSFNKSGGASADVASYDLPANVNVLQDGNGFDEGRAILQVVHDLAPGAKLAFATADISQASYEQNILNLAKPVSAGGAGASVIVDDVYLENDPYFQEGVVAQAIDTVVTTDHVAFFAAAGDFANQAYQSSNVSFYTSTISGSPLGSQQFYNFNSGGFSPANEQELMLDPGQQISLGLQWDQPFYTTSGVTSDLDMYLLDSSGNVVACSTYDNMAMQMPYQQLNFSNPSTTDTNTYYLAIVKSAGTTPGIIKYENFASSNYSNSQIINGSPFEDYVTYGSTITSEAGDPNAFAVAAAPSYDQRMSEYFTSVGPTTILFSPTGVPLSSPLVIAKPDATAIDQVSTTFFDPTDAGNGANGYPLFGGTSAAVADAAGVAALVREAYPTWTPAQIYADLRDTADSTINIPDITGAGLIDAYRAVVGAENPASIPVTDGFETGVLGQDWTTYNSLDGRTEVDYGDGPYSGSYQLVEDSNFNASSGTSLSEAILNVNALGASNLILSFEQKEFAGFDNGSYADANDYPMPVTTSSFTEPNDSNGVCFSVDGINWFPLVNLASSTTNWQSFTANLGAQAVMDGVTLTSDTQIMFQHYDIYGFWAPAGGFGFDNVQVNIGTGALGLTAQTLYLKLDSDHAQLDIWAASSNAGSPAATVLLSQLSSLSINGSCTGGSLTVDFGNGDPLPASGLSFIGAVAQNALLIVGDNSGDTFTVGANSLSLASSFGTVPITFSNTDAITFVAGTGSDKIIQTAQPSGTTTGLTGSTATDSLNVSSGTFTIPAATTGSAPVVFPLQSLTIGGGAQVTVAMPVSHAARTLLKLNTLSIAGSVNGWLGLLDLTGNDMDLVAGGATGLAMIYNQLKMGLYTNPGPLTGITSSAAASDTTQLTTLGSILNTLNGTTKLYSTFDTASVNATDVLVKYTYDGDANLDGKVDGSDYSLIDYAFTHPTLTGWYDGDLNYDGTVDGSDYSLIDNAFNTQGGQL